MVALGDLIFQHAKERKEEKGGGGHVWNHAFFSTAVAERRDRSSESNCMLFCVSAGITHFWLVEAERCLIKALPHKKKEKKKELTDYWGKL